MLTEKQLKEQQPEEQRMSATAFIVGALCGMAMDDKCLEELIENKEGDFRYGSAVAAVLELRRKLKPPKDQSHVNHPFATRLLDFQSIINEVILAANYSGSGGDAASDEALRKAKIDALVAYNNILTLLQEAEESLKEFTNHVEGRRGA